MQRAAGKPLLCILQRKRVGEFRTRHHAEVELRRQRPQGLLNSGEGRIPPQLMKALTYMGMARVLLGSVISTSNRFLISALGPNPLRSMENQIWVRFAKFGHEITKGKVSSSLFSRHMLPQL
jgi:hypothetical protein